MCIDCLHAFPCFLGCFLPPADVYVHYVRAVGVFPLALKNWWEGGAGERSSGCKLWTDWCSLYVLCTFWLNGPFQHLDTLSTWECRRSCRALSLFVIPPLYLFSLSRHTTAQLASFFTPSFSQYFGPLNLFACLIKP